MDLDWFPFFLRDFDEGTREMTNEEVGAYLRLLYYHFHHGSIPADQARAGYITGERLTDSVWATLRQKFTDENAPPERLINVRMCNVRAVAEAAFRRRSEANRLNGQKGGLARGRKLRALAESGANAQPERIASDSLSDSPANGKPPASEWQANLKHIEEKKEERRLTTESSSKKQTQGTKTLRARRSRRAPEDFKIDPVLGTWIQGKFPSVPVDVLRVWTAKQLEKFRNHEFASPRSDWPATFRNWVLTCIDRGDVPAGAPRGSGDEEKRWKQTLELAAMFGMQRQPEESREVFAARVMERNQRRLAQLEQQKRG